MAIAEIDIFKVRVCVCVSRNDQVMTISGYLLLVAQGGFNFTGGLGGWPRIKLQAICDYLKGIETTHMRKMSNFIEEATQILILLNRANGAEDFKGVADRCNALWTKMRAHYHEKVGENDMIYMTLMTLSDVMHYATAAKVGTAEHMNAIGSMQSFLAEYETYEY